jgi:hypothetical protein
VFSTSPSFSTASHTDRGTSQQEGSYVTEIDQNCFEKTGRCYSIYGFEYKPGFDDGYIQWIANNQTAWYMTSQSLLADPVTGIGARPIPQEPMYLIVNLGQSTGFVHDISPLITYPVTMSVDYIRVYQPKGQINVGCDPKDFPTAKYINECVRLDCHFSCLTLMSSCSHLEAYTNPNYTEWGASTTGGTGYGQAMPKNSFLGQC